MTDDQFKTMMATLDRIAVALEASIPLRARPKKTPQEKQWEPDDTMKSFNRMVGRRDTTVWMDDELAKFRIVRELLDPGDLEALEAFYTYKPKPGEVDERYLRVNLITLLNHLMGEVDKSRRWAAARSSMNSKPTEARLRVL